MNNFAACALLVIALATSGVTRAQTPAAWTVTEVWRVDGSEAGEPFAKLRDFVVLKSGHLWALDFKDQNIRRYGPDGKFIAIAGHVGKGPGEMSDANGMAVAGDGSVWVNDPTNARINVFAADGKFLRQISRDAGGYGFRWDGWFNKTSGQMAERSIGASPNVWQVYDAQGKKLGIHPYTSCASGPSGPGVYRAETKGKGSTGGQYPFESGGGIAPDGRGNLWCAAARASRAALIPLGKSDTVAKTSVEIPNMPVSRAERESVIAAIEKRVSMFTETNFDKSKVADSKPGISALYVDDDERLWVQHSPSFEKRATTFDVFDAKGKLLGRVNIPSRQGSVLPVRARGDLVWLGVLDDDDVVSIVQYRIQK